MLVETQYKRITKHVYNPYVYFIVSFWNVLFIGRYTFKNDINQALT